MSQPTMSSRWTAASMPPQAGRTVLITGANSGIGYITALELARHGARVLLGVRDRSRGEAALARLKGEVPSAHAQVAELDMASLASIRAFAERFAAAAHPLDVLINNAGVMALPERRLTADGFEMQIGTNHLGHFALTGLLMPQLLASNADGGPRVVTVASLAHRNGRIDFDNLQSERSYVPWDAYNNSKLANILFALELNRRARAAGSRLRSLAVHPGIAKTNIFSATGGADLKTRVMQLLAPVLMQDDAMGALPTLYAAAAPEAQGGQYIGPGGLAEFKGFPQVVEPRPHATDEAVAQRLWEASQQLTGVVYPPLA